MALICPKCGKIAGTMDTADELFGRRTMLSGKEIWQSWCRECRRNERREAAQPKIHVTEVKLVTKQEMALMPAIPVNGTVEHYSIDTNPGAINDILLPEMLRLSELSPAQVKSRYVKAYPNDHQSRSTNTMRKRLESKYASRNRH